MPDPSEKWWHKWENVTALSGALGGVLLVFTHVILRANKLAEVSTFLSDIGLPGSIGVAAILGSGLFVALQRQTVYLQRQVSQGDTMIKQEKEAVVEREKVADKVATKVAEKVLTESALAADLANKPGRT